jgi:phage tail-like protein
MMHINYIKKGFMALSILLIIAFTLSQATDFVVNTHRFDPYKQFKFRVKWDNKYISGIFRVNGLHRTTKVVTMRDGTDPNTVKKIPGETNYQPIILERGRTHDIEFEKWANEVRNYGSGKTGSSKDFRKDITIELLNEAGQVVMAFHVYRCWPSRYSPLQELDANSTGVAIETIVLEHEGWERDYEVHEPVEPSFTIPQ